MRNICADQTVQSTSKWSTNVGQWFVSSLFTNAAKRSRRLAIIVLLAGATTALAANVATKYSRDARANTAPAASAGVPVTVSRLEPQTVSPFAEFSGRINAVNYAEIRPQVSGRITEIRFHDGEHVSAGDVLFVIDPRGLHFCFLLRTECQFLPLYQSFNAEYQLSLTENSAKGLTV